MLIMDTHSVVRKIHKEFELADRSKTQCKTLHLARPDTGDCTEIYLRIGNIGRSENNCGRLLQSSQLRNDLIIITAAATALRNLMCLIHKHEINVHVGALNQKVMHTFRGHYENEMVILLKVYFSYRTDDPVVSGGQLVLQAVEHIASNLVYKSLRRNEDGIISCGTFFNLLFYVCLYNKGLTH